MLPLPTDRGAEQGDVLECSLALDLVAGETRGHVAAQQASGSFLWIGVDDPSEVQREQAEHTAKLQRVSNFQLGGLGKLTGADAPRHSLQKNGGLADLWYMDDGTRSWCHLTCTNSMTPMPKLERNETYRKINYYVDDLNAAPEWKVDNVRKLPVYHTRSRCGTSSVRCGDQLLAKADVFRAMHERVQLCQDPQTEFALQRESLGASRINHILRVHDHTIHRNSKLQKSTTRSGSGLSNGTVTELEHPSSASLDDGSDDMDFSSTSQEPTQFAAAPSAAFTSDRTLLRRLKNTLLSKGAWQQGTRIEDLCHTQVALPLRRMCGKCPDAARLHHQRAENTWGVDRLCVAPS